MRWKEIAAEFAGSLICGLLVAIPFYGIGTVTGATEGLGGILFGGYVVLAYSLSAAIACIVIARWFDRSGPFFAVLLPATGVGILPFVASIWITIPAGPRLSGAVYLLWIVLLVPLIAVFAVQLWFTEPAGPVRPVQWTATACILGGLLWTADSLVFADLLSGGSAGIGLVILPLLAVGLVGVYIHRMPAIELPGWIGFAGILAGLIALLLSFLGVRIRFLGVLGSAGFFLIAGGCILAGFGVVRQQGDPRWVYAFVCAGLFAALLGMLDITTRLFSRALPTQDPPIAATALTFTLREHGDRLLGSAFGLSWAWIGHLIRATSN